MDEKNSSDEFWQDLTAKLQIFATQITSIFLDSLFLALWVFTEWALDKYVIEALKLSGISKWVLITFQIVFSISTLAVTLSYAILDLVIILTKNWRTMSKVFLNEQTNKAVITDPQAEIK